MSCGPRWASIEAFGAPASDRTVSAPYVFAVLGNVDPPARGLTADLAAMEVDAVVVAGDLVARSTPAGWQRAAERLGGWPVLGALGGGESTGDPALRGAHAAWPDGLWGHLTVTTRRGPVRWVFLDPRGSLDQRFWLPGVLADPLVGAVVVLGQDAPDLERTARSAVAPEDLAAVVRGGGGVNSFALPEGPWGAADVGAGAGGGPPQVLDQDDVSEAFAAALGASFARDVPAVAERHQRGEPFRPPAFATTGWWHVVVDDEARITWSLRRRDAAGVWSTVFETVWSPAGGHQAVEPVVRE